jgi:hypothetical protein
VLDYDRREDRYKFVAIRPRAAPDRSEASFRGERASARVRWRREQPDPEPEVRAKFHELAGTMLTREGAVAVEHAVDHAETWVSVSDLMTQPRVISAPENRLRGRPGMVSQQAFWCLVARFLLTSARGGSARGLWVAWSQRLGFSRVCEDYEEDCHGLD